MVESANFQNVTRFVLLMYLRFGRYHSVSIGRNESHQCFSVNPQPGAPVGS